MLESSAASQNNAKQILFSFIIILLFPIYIVYKNNMNNDLRAEEVAAVIALLYEGVPDHCLSNTDCFTLSELCVHAAAKVALSRKTRSTSKQTDIISNVATPVALRCMADYLACRDRSTTACWLNRGFCACPGMCCMLAGSVGSARTSEVLSRVYHLPPHFCAEDFVRKTGFEELEYVDGNEFELQQAPVHSEADLANAIASVSRSTTEAFAKIRAECQTREERARVNVAEARLVETITLKTQTFLDEVVSAVNSSTRDIRGSIYCRRRQSQSATY